MRVMLMLTNPMNRDERYFTHHGVKGMKWGVRKDRRAAKKVGSVAEKAAKLHDYDTAELKTAVERLELENRYLRAAKEQADLTSARAVVNDIIKALDRVSAGSSSLSKIGRTVTKAGFEVYRRYSSAKRDRQF